MFIGRIDRAIAGALLLGTAGCAAAAAPSPAAKAGASCEHFDSRLHAIENVSNCELRNRDTLINGLPPSYPGDRS